MESFDGLLSVGFPDTGIRNQRHNGPLTMYVPSLRVSTRVTYFSTLTSCFTLSRH